MTITNHFRYVICMVQTEFKIYIPYPFIKRIEHIFKR